LLYQGQWTIHYPASALVSYGAATENVWTHLAMVRAGGTTTMYINGVAQATTFTNAPPPPQPDTASSEGGFSIGARYRGSQNTISSPFDGLIDEVRVWTFDAGTFNASQLLASEVPAAYAIDPANSSATVSIADGFSAAASDGFESGDGTGGTGWSGNWSLTGNAGVTTSHAPYTGSNHLQLSSTDSATRSADLSSVSAANAKLEFYWKSDSLEAGETATARIYDGSQWHTVLTVDHIMSDGQYHLASIDLLGYTLNSGFQVEFKVNGNDNTDLLWIDSLVILG